MIAPDDMNDRQRAILCEFVRDTTDSAFAAGYITRYWNANDKAVTSLRGYCEAGLSPDEAAACLFSKKH